jgi:hypothetical protein
MELQNNGCIGLKKDLLAGILNKEILLMHRIFEFEA